MKINLTLPKVDVLDEENFTRRVRVLVRGSLALDVNLDEEEEVYSFETDRGEFRVEVAQQGDERPTVFVADVNRLEDFSDPYFYVEVEKDEEEQIEDFMGGEY